MDKNNPEQEAIVKDSDIKASPIKENSYQNSPTEVVAKEMTACSPCSEELKIGNQTQKKETKRCKKCRSIKKKNKPVTLDDIYDTFTLDEPNSYPDVMSCTEESKQHQARLCISHMADVGAMPTNRSAVSQMKRANQFYHYLLVVRVMIRNLDVNDVHPLSLKYLALKNLLNDKIFKCLDEPDDDLRLISAECILEMFRKFGYSYFREIKPALIILIKSKMCKKEVRCMNYKQCKLQCNCHVMLDAQAHIDDRRLILHFTMLFEMVKQLQHEFIPEVDEIILKTLFTSWSYRHEKIREIGFNIADEMIKTGMIRDSPYQYRFAAYMVQGLADSVSAVRMTSGRALRNLCLHLKEEDKESYFSLVLPVLCISRYYQGDAKFLLFSQETWDKVMGRNGITYVTRYFSDVVQYYFTALKTQISNIPIRVTACYALVELVNKIEWSTLEKYITKILRAFEDAIISDQVDLSDAAMVALASCIYKYPEVTLPTVDHTLQNLLENLGHPISQVRKGASAALAHIFFVYGMDYARRILYPIYKGLYRIPSMPPIMGTLKQNGETKKATTNEDVVEFKTWELFSIGTPDAHLGMLGFPKSVKPWLILDGAIFLTGDLANIDKTSSFIAPLITSVIQACHHRNYMEHVIVLDSLCQVIPLLAKAMKRQEFKQYLEDFFDNIFYLIDMKNDFSPVGSGCLRFLGTHFGRNIIRGRVATYNPRYLDHYDGLFR